MYNNETESQYHYWTITVGTLLRYDMETSPDIDAIEKGHGSPFSVSKCQHGHIHIHLHQITVTLSQSEFQTFAQTVTSAYLRYGVEEAIVEASASPH